MKFTRERRQDPSIDLTPMIDVVFQLLLFFMVTTTFITDQQKSDAASPDDERTPGIKVDLPNAASATAVGNNDDLTVWIAEDGEIYVGDQRVSRDALGRYFEGVAAENRNRLVVIKADKGVAHGIVVEVMDAVRSAKLTKIGISTQTRGTAE